MPFQVRTEKHATSSGLDGTVYVLEESTGAARAEVWPAFGNNCYHWSATRVGRRLNLLYTDPQLFQNSSPTRSGIPTLFPFPNRIRDGQFSWGGKAYSLPRNDSTKRNAIHGFACRRPWRVVGQGASATDAWLTSEFRGSIDAPDSLDFWPADYQIQLTYRLAADRLRLEATVTNPDTVALPFGLGYHPYFQVPFTPEGSPGQFLVSARASSLWELQDSLPTGEKKPLDHQRDLTYPRPFSELTLDDVLTDLQPVNKSTEDVLMPLAHLCDTTNAYAMMLLSATPSFRELVVFTPPHRKAICLEPYTCPTDAINLTDRGLDVGWLVLNPGEKWSGVVEIQI